MTTIGALILVMPLPVFLVFLIVVIVLCTPNPNLIIKAPTSLMGTLFRSLCFG